MSIRYSTIFEHKLPAFIRDDPSYTRFIQFFDAYYEWFDDTYDIYGLGDKLDIDSGFNEFYAYYAQDFLPNFPDIDTIATDKVKLIKIAKELYKSKGIPDSFKFLFKALYNSNVEIQETSKFILRASDGKWIAPKSIKIKSTDQVFLNIDNFKVLGEISKSVGTIEKSVVHGKYIQIYLSNIRRLFSSGEPIRILDYDDKDVYFINGKYAPYEKTPPIGGILLTSKIIGSLSSIDINPSRRGAYYRTGDPVVITGGLSKYITDPIGATAYVSEVTTGRITNILINNGGYGFTVSPNSIIDVVKSDGEVDPNASCIVSFVDETKPANVAYISNDCIEENLFTELDSVNYNFSFPADIDTKLEDCFSFLTYPTYPIVGVTVVNGGGGYDAIPSIQFHSTFKANTVNQYTEFLEDLGMLAPIQINDGGQNYTLDDTITVSGGGGFYAFAQIHSVDEDGAISKVEYYYNPNIPYGIGGMGYSNDNLPTIIVNSLTGSGANLSVPGILSSGVKYSMETDKIGAITKITLSENGEDYISAPNVSLRMQDIVITGLNIDTIENSTSLLYQGTLQNQTFYGNISSITPISYNAITDVELFSIRVYDYKGVIDPVSSINVYSTITETSTHELSLDSTYSTDPYTNGIKMYGDGTALASAKFLNGLIEDAGRYLNTDGQPSAHSVLQSDIYNLSTYILSTEKDYSAYKDVVKNLLHPIGTQIITRNLIKSNTELKSTPNTVLNDGINRSNVMAVLKLTDPTNYNFSNTLSMRFESLDVEITNLFAVNDRIAISESNFYVYSTISNINETSNEITLSDYIQYKFPNVYNGYTSSNSIAVLLNNYKSSRYDILSLVGIGDIIDMGTNIDSIVTGIDTDNNILYFANDLNQSGSRAVTANISVTKELVSNNITIFKTV
jgi:hypothetical protein